MGKYDREIADAASILSRSTRASASTGAGFSAESSIATFRDPGGIWDQIDPMEAGTVEGLISTIDKKADKLVPLFLNMLDSFEQADPNPGHQALAALEDMDILHTVITQNVDNLHQEAGTLNLVEVHGNLFQMVCTGCSRRRSVDRRAHVRSVREKLLAIKTFDLTSLLTLALNCGICGAVMRPDVVMFGEAVKDLNRAFQTCLETDAMLVLGTSGVVYPAASFPRQAKEAGAAIIVINPTENAFEDVSDVYIPMKSGEALPLIVAQIQKTAY
jgi:NAD-dependent deacetylase